MKVLRVRASKEGVPIVEFRLEGDDPDQMRDQLRDACVVAESLGYAAATVEDLDGQPIELPTDVDDIEVVAVSGASSAA